VKLSAYTVAGIAAQTTNAQKIKNLSFLSIDDMLLSYVRTFIIGESQIKSKRKSRSPCEGQAARG
jgi:hypothetical protein